MWAVYPSYDIFEANDDGIGLKRLTTAMGYDAEATVNWKTKKIIYTSMASGDLDLWTMNLDGSGKKQITKVMAMTAGAVFSRDGKKIAWRAGHPATAGDEAEICGFAEREPDEPVEDGTVRGRMRMERNAKQITNFGCASFAPTFTPDGKQILFSSNKLDCDGRKFELFLINIGWHRAEAGDGFPWVHSSSAILAGWEDAGVCYGLESVGAV